MYGHPFSALSNRDQFEFGVIQILVGDKIKVLALKIKLHLNRLLHTIRMTSSVCWKLKTKH